MHTINRAAKTPDYNWGSRVKVNERQIEIAEVIKNQLKGLTLKEAEDILMVVNEQLPMVTIVS